MPVPIDVVKQRNSPCQCAKSRLATINTGSSHTNCAQRVDQYRAEAATPLFDEAAIGKHRERWQAIQADFVDDPRQAVTEADELVAELIQQLAKSFADERSKLEGQWGRGDDVSTEDMRIALQRYRSFFGRLLTV